MQKVFPDAEVGFFAMCRNEETLCATTSYMAMPDVKGKVVVIADTMLATGGSFLNAIRVIKKQAPKKIILVSAIAAKEGIEKIVELDPDIQIFAAAIDPVLNEKGYIVPGLGEMRAIDAMVANIEVSVFAEKFVIEEGKNFFLAAFGFFRLE